MAGREAAKNPPKTLRLLSRVIGLKERHPSFTLLLQHDNASVQSQLLPSMSVTLHTNLGDIKIEVFCESVPKTAEVNISTISLHNRA